ncbi:MAG: AAA family ATPase [Actinobacteria bacterium]|nr:AAA family ATPase [Actinomycetota bacterium]
MALRRDGLEISLLGGFSVSYGGQQLPPLPTRPARLLFSWLALQAGRPQPRTMLTDRFWPDAVESRGRRRLSHVLWQVQDSLSELAPEQPYLLTPGDVVMFDATAPYWLDVEEFEQRLDAIDRAGTVDGAGLRSLRRCVELYHGDLLAGSYEPWVLAEQDRLRQRYVTALDRLVAACKQRGNFDEALMFARRLTHQAPLREDSHREVMRLYMLLGQPSQALEQFERCRSVLAEELGAEPSADTVALHTRISQIRGVSVATRKPVEQLVSHRLIGRDDDRLVLVDQVERTLSGAGGTVFVEGEAGIGKTQLVTQAAEDARWRGLTVLWGGCDGRDRPYAPLADALLPQLGPVQVAQLVAQVDDVWLRQAAVLLPPLQRRGSAPASGRDPSALTGADASERMREALIQVLLGLAALEAVVLVVEDVHRADHETLALLQGLARRSRDARLLVVLTFRDVDARQDEPVWAALRDIDRDARPVRLHLDALSPFETAGLLREVLGTTDVPASFAGTIHRAGGGNPLYLLEMLRSLRDAGSLGSRERESLDRLRIPVSESLRALIGERLALFDPATVDLVRLGAVLGPDFAIETLQAASGRDRSSVSGALHDLLQRNVLEIDDGRCRFTHAATRRVLLDSLSEDDARRLNEVAAGTLETTEPDEIERLAQHFQRAGLPHRAVPYLRRAADRAVQLHGYATAAEHLRLAAELSGSTPTSAEARFDLLLQLESVLDVLGRREEQEDVLTRLQALTGVDVGRRLEVDLRQATYLAHVDRFAEATAIAGQAADRAAASGTALHARALVTQGRILSWSGRNAEAVPLLRSATTRLAEDDPERSQALFALGGALRSLQRFDEARTELQTALALVEEHDDSTGAVQVLGALADLHAETGTTELAVRLHGRAIALAGRIGYRHREAVGLVNLGTVHLARGEPVPARGAYDRAIALFRGLGNRRGIAMVELNRAWLQHRWLADDDAADRDADAARRYFDEIGSRGLAAVALETTAGIARRRGDLDGAQDLLSAGLVEARSADDQRAEVQIRRGQLELAVAAGDAGDAVATAEDALALATRVGLDEFVPDLASLAARCRLDAGDDDGAWQLATLAAERVGASAEPHRVHHRVAEVAAATSRPEATLDHRLRAFACLTAAMADLDERGRAAATEGVEEHEAITTLGREVSPRRVAVRLARRDAARGRPLLGAERIDVTVDLDPPPPTPGERRHQLLHVLDQIRDQEAEATVEDLAVILEVSASTVRRDLRHLRTEGHRPATRGTGTG